MYPPTILLVVMGWIEAGLLFVLLWWITKKKLQRLRRPRVLVAQESIPSLYGSYIIDGVQVREGDTVVLTRQNTESTNGVWTVKSGAWERARPIATGDWVWVTNGSQSDSFWLLNPSTTYWERVHPSSRLVQIDSPDFAPNNPAEAAAYLYRNGIRTTQIHGSRRDCIESLVAGRFMSRTQGDLFLAKPENLTTEILDPSATLVRLVEQSWASQVVAHMLAIRDTHRRFMIDEGYGDRLAEETRILNTFTQRELLGFKIIKEKNPPEPPPEPQRRSRYERPPVI